MMEHISVYLSSGLTGEAASACRMPVIGWGISFVGWDRMRAVR